MRLWRILVILCVAMGGCNRAVDVPKSQTLPVKGTVTLDGKPLAGAQVMFMTGDPPSLFAGTTDSSGAYQLQGRGSSLQGECKVTVSQFLKPDGAPLAPGETPADTGAAEQLPAKYSQFDQTTLSATVGAEGGTFDFALESK